MLIFGWRVLQPVHLVMHCKVLHIRQVEYFMVEHGGMFLIMQMIWMLCLSLACVRVECMCIPHIVIQRLTSLTCHLNPRYHPPSSQFCTRLQEIIPQFTVSMLTVLLYCFLTPFGRIQSSCFCL